mmetsp:Transcript_16897/g.33865  ORF Transcript_16897/g.33865 Transcript_16897/m.33865 type:complete len:91 (-) Transcript_16897:61-333(-)
MTECCVPHMMATKFSKMIDRSGIPSTEISVEEFVSIGKEVVVASSACLSSSVSTSNVTTTTSTSTLSCEFKSVFFRQYAVGDANKGSKMP